MAKATHVITDSGRREVYAKGTSYEDAIRNLADRYCPADFGCETWEEVVEQWEASEDGLDDLLCVTTQDFADEAESRRLTRDPYLGGFSPLHACFEQVGLANAYMSVVESILHGGARPGLMVGPKSDAPKHSPRTPPDMPTAPETLTLGERLRALIEKKRGPIEPGTGPVAQLARDAGLGEVHLHMILAGTRTPRQATLERILAALGATQAELWR